MNLQKKIVDLDGSSIMFPGKKEGEKTYKTVGDFLAAMLVQNNRYNNNLNFDMKVKQYNLAKRIIAGGEIKDIDKKIDLKKVVHKSNYPMMIQAQVYEEVEKYDFTSR